MKTKITIILLIIACALMFIGAGCFSIVQCRYTKRSGGILRSLLIKPTDADIKLMKIGAL